jgi:hypothetical protein
MSGVLANSLHCSKGKQILDDGNPVHSALQFLRGTGTESQPELRDSGILEHISPKLVCFVNLRLLAEICPSSC